MYLLFVLCDDLQANYTIQYVKGAPPNEDTFPKGASNKTGWPKFEIKDNSSGKVMFQICAGTGAGDIHGTKHAIDVSIQTGTAGDNPGPDDVLQIFDAKYRSKAKSRISKHEFSEFVRWVELFDLRGAGTAGLVLNSLGALDANCLVTNGEPSTAPDAECIRTSVREVTKFHPNETLTHRP